MSSPLELLSKLKKERAAKLLDIHARRAQLMDWWIDLDANNMTISDMLHFQTEQANLTAEEQALLKS